METAELTNQGTIKTHSEKENSNYLGILEADTIKQMDTKKERKKRVLQKQNTAEMSLLE